MNKMIPIKPILRKVFQAIFLVIFIFPLVPAQGKRAQQEQFGKGMVVQSPDGSLRFAVFPAGNRLSYSVTLKNHPVVEASPMVVTVDGTDITQITRLGKTKKTKGNETYPWLGLHAVATNRYNGCAIALKSLKGLHYTLEIRVFNDAAAFRFMVPGSGDVLRTPDEATVFTFPSGSTTWYHDFYMHYEGVHARKDVDTIPAGQWAAPVVTVKLPHGTGYAAVTEANLVNYAGMGLQTNGKRGFVVKLAHAQPVSYPYELRYTKEDIVRLSKIASITGSITTPWRVILAGSDLNALVNSDAIHNLCPPPDPKLFPMGDHTGWIRPGRAVWKYLDGGGAGSAENMKRFSREAADLGFEQNVLEGFWSRWSDDSIRHLVDYSKEKNVGIFVWVHSKNLRDPAVRQQLFKRCHNLGISGLKIDFFDHEAKEVIDLYTSVMQESAEQQLMLIFHGANKPTGLERTWPNIMIYESVKGMEASKLEDRATHETTIPFTRMLAGPADYSVVHLGDRRRNTTWAHQIATAAVFSAPVITYASTPANLLANPAVEMIKSIPSTWDETKVLPPSEIGELAIYAQRKGETWFLSVINGLSPKKLTIPLLFLGNDVYKALIVRDDPGNPAAVKMETNKLTKEGSIDIEMGKGGGFIAKFVKE